jgi:hypothetical protein
LFSFGKCNQFGSGTTTIKWRPLFFIKEIYFDGDNLLLKIPFDLLLLFNAEIFPFVFPILLSKQKWKNVFLRKKTEN